VRWAHGVRGEASEMRAYADAAFDEILQQIIG
jgi:hypothetical protein